MYFILLSETRPNDQSLPLNEQIFDTNYYCDGFRRWNIPSKNINETWYFKFKSLMISNGITLSWILKCTKFRLYLNHLNERKSWVTPNLYESVSLFGEWHAIYCNQDQIHIISAWRSTFFSFQCHCSESLQCLAIVI